MNEFINEGMNEWTNERTNKWINASAPDCTFIKNSSLSILRWYSFSLAAGGDGDGTLLVSKSEGRWFIILLYRELGEMLVGGVVGFEGVFLWIYCLSSITTYENTMQKLPIILSIMSS